MVTYWDDLAAVLGPAEATCNGLDWDTLTADMAAQVAAHLPSGRLLDLGCGMGRLSAPVAERLDAEVVGVDYTAAMLAAAPVSHRAGYVRGDVARLPFASGSFDGAWSVLVAQHLDAAALRLLFAEAARVLRAGAPLVVQWVFGDHHDPAAADHRWTLGELREHAASARLRLNALEGGVHPDWLWTVWR